MAKLLLATIATAVLHASAYGQTQPHQVQAREIYARVVGFRTAPGHQQTAPMVAYLIDVLKRGSVPASDIAIVAEGEATAMIVRVPGSGSRRPILFSAHMDVVDARAQEWTRDPFTLVEEQGHFFGRGTADNKAGVVALISTILRLKAQQRAPGRDLVFAFVGDEETDMKTTRFIVRHPWVEHAEFAINTDAGGGMLDNAGKELIYLLQNAEKTYVTFELTVINPGGHASRPRQDNAIYQLARALLKVEGYRFPVMANSLTRQYLGAVGQVETGQLGAALRRFAADPQDAAAADMLWSVPEFVGTTRTTCVATMLEAGHAENALPQTAKGTVNCRVFPGVAVATVQQALAAAVADPQVAIDLLGTPTPSPMSALRPDVLAAIERAVHVTHPRVTVVPYQESGGTDGKIYRSFGIPTFGSSGGFANPDTTYAHGLNERLPVAAFYEGLDHIYLLATELGPVADDRRSHDR
jgi:acetylornithine deacetylase/succinyl-diaminopimelate desuccinylase-like protein